MKTQTKFVRLSNAVMLSLSTALLLPPAVLANQGAAPFLTAYRYNLNRQETGVIRPSADGSAQYLAYRKSYNNRGLLERLEDGSLSAWQDESTAPADWSPYNFTVARQKVYTYDDLGRLETEAILDFDGQTTGLVQYSYNDENQLVCKTVRMNPAAYAQLPSDACSLGFEGANGPDRITHFDYNGYGQITQEKRAYGTALVQTYVTNQYASGLSNSRLTDQIDANGNLTHLAYDGLGRLQFMYFPSKTAAGSYSGTDYEQYGYDANSNRTSLKKRDGRSISYNYDNLNRIVSEIYPASTIQNVYYSYDLRNLQLAARFGSLAGIGLTHAYDGFGQLRTASTNQGSALRTLSYGFDANNNRTSVQHPDGSSFSYAYDGLDRLTSVRENGATPVATIGYDGLGRRQILTRGAGSTSTVYAYDGAGRLQTLNHDLAGSANDEVRGFSYNPASQITGNTLSNSKYLYAELGNMTTNYVVNGLNQYTQLTAARTVSPTHDANGNMTYDGTNVFGFDVLNRLTSAVGSKTVNLSYDPKGRLFQTVGNVSGTQQYLYDGDALVAEYDGAGNLLRRYVHGSGVDEPLVWYEGAGVSAANRRYHHVDHQGSVTAVADTNGNGLATNTYDPYGVPAITNIGRFQYTGQIVLPDLTGLYHYKARVYHAGLGRFLQTDPIGYKDDFDLYSYVGEDPMNRTDPTGLAGLDWLHNTLTVASFCPSVCGSAVSIIDAGIHLAEGNRSEAAMSAVAAGIGIFSDAGAAKVGIKIAENVAEKIAAKGVAGGERAGKSFTRAGKNEVKSENAATHGGQTTCNGCGQPTVPAKQSQSGVTPPGNETHVDHIIPKSKSGDGLPSNGQVLCRDCNLRKSDN